jgi:hypothetical protein
VSHASALLTARYSTAWQDIVPSFQTAAARSARASVGRTCDALARDQEGAGRTSSDLAAAQIDGAIEVAELASTLALFDDGMRSLLLDEFVDEFSKVVVGQALLPSGDPHVAATSAAVEVFIRRCLVGQAY